MMAVYDGPGPGGANGNGSMTMLAGMGENGEFVPADGTDNTPGLVFFGSVHTPGTDQPPIQNPLHGDGIRRVSAGHLSMSLVGQRAYEWTTAELRPAQDSLRSLGTSSLRFKELHTRDIESGNNAVRLRNTSGIQDGL